MAFEKADVAIYLLAIATFVTFLSAEMIAPILPVLAAKLGARDLSIVSVSGAYMIALATFQIFTGALADRFGKRIVIAFGALIAALSAILSVFVWSWEQLLALRIIAAVGASISGPALLALVSELSGTKKGQAMGIFRSSQGLSLILGPIMGGTIAHFYSIYSPFYVNFGLTMFGISIFLLLVPEIKRKGRELSSPFASISFIRRDLTLLKIAFLGFTETFAFASLISFVPAFAIKLGMSEIEIATFFTAEAVTFTLTNVIVGSLSDRIGRKPIMIIGLSWSSASFISFFFATGYLQILLLMITYGFGSTCVYLMSSTMAADVLPEENKAMLFGAFDGLMDVGMVFGPAFCIAFLAFSGWSINYSFLLMAIPSLMAFGIIFGIRETKK